MKVTAIRALVVKTRQVAPKDLGRDSFVYVDISSIDREIKRIDAPQTVSAFEAPSRARKLIMTGDVLVSTVRPNLNAVALVGLAFSGEIASTGFCVLRPIESKLDSKYLYYFCQDQEFVDRLTRLSIGAGYPAVSDDHILDTEIPLPPLPEQQRIAGILGRADRLRRLRRYALELSEGYLQSVFLEMFGGIERSHKGWPMMSLSEVAEINPAVSVGYTDFPSDESMSFIPMASVDESDPTVFPRETKRFSEVLTGYTRFREGDVLFAKITPCMENGKVAMVSRLRAGVGFGSTEFHVLRPTSRSNRYWLLWLVRSDRFRLLAKRSFTGTAGQQRVPATFLENFKAPIPPVGLQDKFAIIAERTGLFHSQQREALRQAEHLFQTLLHGAFRGEG